MIKTELNAKLSSIVDCKLNETQMAEVIAFVKEATDQEISQDDEIFFRDITYDLTGEVRELAMLILDFRRDLKAKLHPDIEELATKYIPQTADQLEGIIETLEMAANTLMDNLEAMQGDTENIQRTIASLRQGQLVIPGADSEPVALSPETARKLAPLTDYLESQAQKFDSLIADSFVQMSFQDLTGQRIKRIMNLVGQMEIRLRDMVLSFGIKLAEHEKNPNLTKAALDRVVEEKVAELAGPQKAGGGLDQSCIDDMLANL